MTIANHFVNDKAEADTITVGLNTVREMCRRQPLLMTEDFLHDISGLLECGCAGHPRLWLSTAMISNAVAPASDEHYLSFWNGQGW